MKRLLHIVLLLLVAATATCCSHGRPTDGSANDSISVNNEPPESYLTILVAGDLMQHMPQINAARTAGGYDYTECFAAVKDIISEADVAVANFEVTLGGQPYSGYPRFSCPDEFLQASLDAGFDVLMTSNNHCCDSGLKGLNRTIDMMDSLHVPHFGTYKDAAAREAQYPLLVEKHGFRVVFLGFTYATNGIPVPKPSVVNMIDTVQIAADIAKAKSMNPDLIIAMPHWGIEYQMTPAKPDVAVADWLLSKGVDHVIGGHPHVLQPFERRNADAANGGNVVAYSLGNFVSNQYKPNTTGGAMVRLHFTKTPAGVTLDDCGYILTWVSRPQTSGRKNYRIVPLVGSDSLLNANDRRLRDTHAATARGVFSKYNVDFEEIK